MEESAAATPEGGRHGTADPAVTVVVATRNRSQRLERCLGALARQSPPPSEVIVVDDASTDDTATVLAAVKRDGPLKLRVISREAAGGPGGARNTGWRAADTAYVAFTDDDCEPSAGWLEAIMATARANPDCIVQGPTRPNPSELDRMGPVSRTLEVTSLGPWFPTSNMTYPVEALESVGGFDASLIRGEDTDLAWRAQKAGYGAVWSAGALVDHGVMRIGPLAVLRLALAWSPAVSVVASHPHLRSELILGVFWKRSHALLVLAILGLVVRPRGAGVLLAVPYAMHMRPAPGTRLRALAWTPFLVLKEVAELAGMIRGSIRARFLVL